MRSARIVFAIVFAAAIAAIVHSAATADRDVVQTTGVLMIVPVATVAPGKQACQRPVVTTGRVDALRFNANATPRTPKLEITITDTTSESLLARGAVAANWDRHTPVTVALSNSVPGDRAVAICLRNAGQTVPVLFYGDNGLTDLCDLFPASIACRFHFAHPTSSTSVAYANGEPVSGTINLELLRDHPVSLLSEIGAIMDRASTFRPGFVGPVLWWMLLAGALLVVPAALWWAIAGLRESERATRTEGGRGRSG